MLKTKIMTVFAALTVLAVGCEKDKKKDPGEIKTPEPEIVEVGANSEGIINVGISAAGDDGYAVSLGDLPDNGVVECELNGVKLGECYDGMQLKVIAAGNQILRVRSVNSGRSLSVGEIRFNHEVVLGSSSGSSAGADPVIAGEHPLALHLTNDSFRNGSAIPISKGLSLEIAAFSNAPCAEPVLRCRYDRTNSPFWPKCSGSRGHTVAPERMAKGLQYLSMRAECGSQVGPSLDLYWYGVGDSYEPLAVQLVEVSSKARVLRLQKANDCPEEWLLFECRKTATDQFKRCDANIRASSLVPGFAARALCRDQAGPPFVVER